MTTIYVFGSGDCGQLGLGEDVLYKKVPVALSRFQVGDIAQISAGGLHNLALSSSGQVYSWGCNDEKALGHDGDEWSIGKVERISSKVVWVTCGDSISAAVTDQGQVYAWGTFRDSHGILGFDKNVSIQARPVIMESLSKQDIFQISAGPNHLVALARTGEIFTWGCGEQGQLGRRVVGRHKLSSGLEPRKTTGKRTRQGEPRFAMVACGSYHTLALGTDGSLYSWGLNNHGQLGHGDKNHRQIPEKIQTDHYFTSIAAGEHHSIALTSLGEVCCWGRGDSGQLGIGETEALTPKLVDPNHFGGNKIKLISSGGNHCLASDGDCVYSWGFGEMCQLGNGKEHDEHIPYKIQFQHGQVIQLQGGGQHSVLLCKNIK